MSDKVKHQIQLLKKARIKYEFKQYGGKDMAGISLTNGNKLLVCAHTSTVKYKNRRYSYVNLDTWMKNNRVYPVIIK